MANDTATGVLIVLICFWALLSVFANYFGVELAATRLETVGDIGSTNDRGFFGIIGGLLDFLDNIPIINYFVPLLRIMSFQYSDQVPVILTLLLYGLSLITMLVFFETLRK